MQLLSEFKPNRFSPQMRARFFFSLAVIISGIISICAATLNGAEVKSPDSPVEQVTAQRNPFSLPSGVRFAERVEMVGAYSEFAEWKEGAVASNVNGIFKSGNIVRANINGIWVREGDWVGEEQIVEIGVENVVLTGEEESVRRTLPLREDKANFEVIERVK